MKGEVITQAVYYYSDEAGNRIRKIILQAYIINPEIPAVLDNIKEYPEYDEEAFNQLADEYYAEAVPPGGVSSPPPVWYVVADEFYIRGVEGNELVIFSGNNISKFNFFGSGNEGYIDANGNKFYYLKDHLGSVRVVLNESNGIISAQDYDMWGYLMEGRSYDSNGSKYKFTGKERDRESNYDYFGARYYDARIGRWGGVEPKLEKYYDISPYIYSMNNPIILIDSDGKDPYRKNLGSKNQVLNILKGNEGKSYWELSNIFAKNEVRFIYTEKGGFLDLRHFFAAAQVSATSDFITAIKLGELEEKRQEIMGNESAYNPEDLPSNFKGAEFGVLYDDATMVVRNFETFINELNPLEPTDPKIASSAVYIPYDEKDKPLPKRNSYVPYHGESPNYNNRRIIE